MRVVYATDIHGSFKTLRVLLEHTHADLYILAGDLLSGPFRSSKNFFRFGELDTHFHYLKSRSGEEVDTHQFVEKRLHAPDTKPEDRSNARQYVRLYRLAHKTMQQGMTALEAVLSAFPEKRIKVLPGNYDLDLQGTALAARDIHKRVCTIEGLRVAGHGGANVRTPGIPQGLTVSYREVQRGGTLFSEPRDFLCAVKPDLVALHQPPFGYLDLLSYWGHIGSVGVREFIDQCSPKVVLCGHLHESWGVVRNENTVIINPSNFGRIPDVQGVERGGYFFDFILEEGSYRVGTLRQLEKGEVYDLADYPVRDDGSVKPLFVDPERVHFLSREKLSPTRETRQIRNFNRVRDYFRRYETDETRQRIEDLRKIYRLLSSQGERIAFDVLGSANFGMSEAGSDVDLVVYRRCSCDIPLSEATCTLPRALWECFKELEGSYQIEVTDCLNLEKVEASIRARDASCPVLQRFVFYRSICRPINLRMIRETENLLLDCRQLKRRVGYFLRDYLKLMVLSQSHVLSFKKYENRLGDRGVSLPRRIEQKLHAYLAVHPQRKIIGDESSAPSS